MVAASTSDVYGKNPDVPFAEDMRLRHRRPARQALGYAISKMFEEQLLLAFHERFGIDVVLLRFFGGYGPNQNLTWWGGPQSVFIENALDGEPLAHPRRRPADAGLHLRLRHVDGIVRAGEPRTRTSSSTSAATARSRSRSWRG